MRTCRDRRFRKKQPVTRKLGERSHYQSTALPGAPSVRLRSNEGPGTRDSRRVLAALFNTRHDASDRLTFSSAKPADNPASSWYAMRQRLFRSRRAHLPASWGREIALSRRTTRSPHVHSRADKPFLSRRPFQSPAYPPPNCSTPPRLCTWRFTVGRLSRQWKQRSR